MSSFRIDDIKLCYTTDQSELKTEVDQPTLVEGLLGVGHVGLLAANLLLGELDFQKVANVYSPSFSEPFIPGDTPGVVYSEDGTAKLHSNEVFYNSENDLFIYSGFYQGNQCEFYYKHANLMTDFCVDFGVREIYTLGGLGTGEEREEKEVKAVVARQDHIPQISPHVEILRGKKDRPGVTGLSGLLLGLADKNNIKGICLLGKCHGSFPDAGAAKEVLKVLIGLLDIEVDLSRLDEVSKKLEKKKDKFRKKVGLPGEKEEKGDTHYIG